MSRPDTVVIVGASLTGAKAAEALPDEAFDGRIVLLGEETERPYERPPLSKDYLRGEAGREKVYVHDEGFYAAHDIELRTSTVVVYRGDPKTREFVAFWLQDGRVVAGMNANVWEVAEPIQALIRSQRPVEVSHLADPDVSLEDLAGEAS